MSNIALKRICKVKDSLKRNFRPNTNFDESPHKTTSHLTFIVKNERKWMERGMYLPTYSFKLSWYKVCSIEDLQSSDEEINLRSSPTLFIVSCNRLFPVSVDVSKWVFARGICVFWEVLKWVDWYFRHSISSTGRILWWYWAGWRGKLSAAILTGFAFIFFQPL